MSLTGKQKRFLRGLGVDLAVVLQVGKAGITEPVVKQAAEALLARELIKVRVLPGSGHEAAAVAEELAAATAAELVQVVGHNFLLYKPDPEGPQLRLPPGPDGA